MVTSPFRHVVMLVIAVLLTGASALSQGVTFENNVLDLGTVKQHAMAQGLFRFTNLTADTIIFADPRSGCGCTAALLSSPILLPGATGTLQVKFTASSGMLGQVVKEVHVFQRTRRGPLPEVRLLVQADVAAELKADTGHVRLSAYPGEDKSIVFSVQSTTDKVISLDNVSLAFMEYADTTAGNQYHVEKVIQKPFTDFSFSVDSLTLTPGASTAVRIRMKTHIKGQIHGSIRFALPESEVRIPITCVVYQTKNTE